MIFFSILGLIAFVIVLKKYNIKVGVLCLSFTLLGVGVNVLTQQYTLSAPTKYGVVSEAKDNYFIFQSLERYYVYQKDNQFEAGDVLKISGEITNIDFAVVESGFDFNQYLSNKGIKHQLIIKECAYLIKTPLRMNAYKKSILNGLNKEAKEFISSVMFMNSLDGEFVQGLEKLHLGRFTTVNGFYLYAYVSFISLILSFLMKKQWGEFIAILSIAPYLLFTIGKFTPFRVFVFMLARHINKYFLNNRFSNITIVGFFGLIFLLIDPFLSKQLSFIVAFLAILWQGLIRELNCHKGLKLKIYYATMSFLAFIPLEIYFYQGVTPSLIWNSAILGPLMLFTGFLSVLTLCKLPFASVLIGLSAQAINKVSNFLGKFSFSINANNFNLYGCLLYYIALILIVYFSFTKFKPFLRPLKAIFYCSLFIYFLPINNLITAEVSFINVGQGDACLIRKGDTSVLIDTGGSIYQDLALECLIPYFKKKQLYDIDLVITTHDDYDHSGALESLNNNFKVKKYVNNAYNFPISINGITLKNYNRYLDEYTEENEKSLVIGFTLLKKHFLIMGDAPISIENRIMKDNNYIPCDVLKVGHHGSKTSSSKDFIKYLSPEEAIISVGKNNFYHHPNEEVINILNSQHIRIRRTDIEGTISYHNFIWI